MASFDGNDQNERNGHFSEYVNFDQFLMQHNIGQTSPIYTNNPAFYTPSNVYSMPMFGQQQQIQAPVNVGHSNLVATANEFFPQANTSTQSTTSSSAVLRPGVEEFVPNKHSTNFSGERNANTSHTNESKTSNNNGSGNAGSNGTNKVEKLEDKVHSLSNALGNTHIESKPLDKSGGAIKKVRNQNRYDSREFASNGMPSLSYFNY